MTTPAPRFLITGAGGMLGQAIGRTLTSQGIDHVGFTHSDLDVTDADAVREAIARFVSAPETVVVNAAAYTDVEAAEDHTEDAYAVNGAGAANVASACAAEGARLVHISTDFVFDGEKPGPYTEEDEPNPLSVYGSSKLAGEEAVVSLMSTALIVRTAWIFGPGGANFPSKILARARDGHELRVVDDECGSPTYTVHLARGILALARARAEGVYHLTSQGSCTRFEFAREIVAGVGLVASVVPVKTDDFPTKALRPRNSVLDCSKASALGVELPPWPEGLDSFLQEGTGV